jgi:hypothetical protein
MKATLLKLWPVLIVVAGVVAAAARTEVALSYASDRIEKLEERQVRMSTEVRDSVQELKLNVARICVKVKAGCRE